MKKQYALLKLLLALFLLYVAFPMIGSTTVQLVNLFWLVWFLFFLLIIGANLAVLLNIQTQPNEKYVVKKQMQRMKN
ncbi:membrane protein CcdC involved in cytochrome C biogenesis [Natronobacillus azotifigens]|uniref:Uncharacterized protein n=1 Tax=Natronobacillus azotifigens TaxID=472978 RepID=A0A9J6RCF7_9BACI|nr:hypothetical protein [Natronobacillus azotifigens]MCZ0703197.1 hypothetical protein [Natronobacillus azotifigens]